MKETELKPCPFCGGEAAMDSDTVCGGFGCYSKIVYIRCLECGARGAEADSYYEEDKADLGLIAIEAWNRRAENEQREAD